MKQENDERSHIVCRTVISYSEDQIKCRFSGFLQYHQENFWIILQVWSRMFFPIIFQFIFSIHFLFNFA